MSGNSCKQLFWPSGPSEDFYQTTLYIHLYFIISPLKIAWLFIWRNVNPLQPRVICTKFDWNWLSGSGEYENVNSFRTDYRQKAFGKAHLSFQRRWTKTFRLSIPSDSHKNNLRRFVLLWVLGILTRIIAVLYLNINKDTNLYLL